jgi:hypothetical protein
MGPAARVRAGRRGDAGAGGGSAQAPALPPPQLCARRRPRARPPPRAAARGRRRGPPARAGALAARRRRRRRPPRRRRCTRRARLGDPRPHVRHLAPPRGLHARRVVRVREHEVQVVGALRDDHGDDGVGHVGQHAAAVPGVVQAVGELGVGVGLGWGWGGVGGVEGGRESDTLWPRAPSARGARTTMLDAAAMRRPPHSVCACSLEGTTPHVALQLSIAAVRLKGSGQNMSLPGAGWGVGWRGDGSRRQGRGRAPAGCARTRRLERRGRGFARVCGFAPPLQPAPPSPPRRGTHVRPWRRASASRCTWGGGWGGCGRAWAPPQAPPQDPT